MNVELPDNILLSLNKASLLLEMTPNELIVEAIGCYLEDIENIKYAGDLYKELLKDG